MSENIIISKRDITIKPSHLYYLISEVFLGNRLNVVMEKTFDEYIVLSVLQDSDFYIFNGIWVTFDICNLEVHLRVLFGVVWDVYFDTSTHKDKDAIRDYMARSFHSLEENMWLDDRRGVIIQHEIDDDKLIFHFIQTDRNDKMQESVIAFLRECEQLSSDLATSLNEQIYYEKKTKPS